MTYYITNGKDVYGSIANKKDANDYLKLIKKKTCDNTFVISKAKKLVSVHAPVRKCKMNKK